MTCLNGWKKTKKRWCFTIMKGRAEFEFYLLFFKVLLYLSAKIILNPGRIRADTLLSSLEKTTEELVCPKLVTSILESGLLQPNSRSIGRSRVGSFCFALSLLILVCPSQERRKMPMHYPIIHKENKYISQNIIMVKLDHLIVD